MASVDEVLKLLRNERRRYALYYLMEEGRSEPVHIEEMTEAVARMQSTEDDPVPDEELANLEVSLHHVQMPKAGEAEFVEYDEENRCVRLVGEPPEFEALTTVAEVMEREDENPTDATDRIE